MGIFGALAAFATAAISAYTGYQQYQRRQNQAEYQQEMAEYNAKIRQQQIDREAEATAREQLRIRRQGQEAIGQQESLLASSGVSMTSGSPLEQLAQTSAKIERDVDLAEYEGKMKQASLETAKTESRMRARQAGNRASQYGTAKYIAGARGAVSGIRGTKGLL